MSDKKLQIEMWPRDQVFPHPDNYRSVNVKDPEFRDLVASIKANGIIEPLIVRVHPAAALQEEMKDSVQVLSGHQRLAAAKEAGLDAVPVRNLGVVADDLAYDIVAMANLHKPLTPLEEGKRAAVWLDKYSQDVKAVASKLGKTESWVVQHAQIARGLSADWQREILEAVDHDDRPKWARWTAGHLAVIAKLPATLQAHYLEKVRKDYRFFNWPGWTVGQIEEAVKLDLLYLAKAPFDAGTCSSCVDRTDRQPLLWANAVEEATGDKARCLNRKCWDKKCQARAREQFKDVMRKAYIAGEMGASEVTPVPICLREEPQDYSRREAHRKEVSALKKTFPKLITADRVQIVKEGAKGAVPTIVVAGDRKHKRDSVVWVKVSEKRGDTEGTTHRPTAAELARQKAEEEARQRKVKVTQSVYAQLAKAERPEDATVLYVCLATGSFPGTWPDEIKPKELADWRALWSKRRKDFVAAAMKRLWAAFVSRCRERAKVSHYYPDWWKQLLELGPIFKISPDAELAKITPKKAKASTAGVCRVCGCTDADCSGCVEATGQACTWVEPDLCSRCAGMRAAQKPADRTPLAVPKKGDRTCRMCELTDQNCTNCAGTVCEECHWEESDLCVKCALKGQEMAGPGAKDASSDAAAKPKRGRGRPRGRKDAKPRQKRSGGAPRKKARAKKAKRTAVRK